MEKREKREVNNAMIVGIETWASNNGHRTIRTHGRET